MLQDLQLMKVTLPDLLVQAGTTEKALKSRIRLTLN